MFKAVIKSFAFFILALFFYAFFALALGLANQIQFEKELKFDNEEEFKSQFNIKRERVNVTTATI